MKNIFRKAVQKVRNTTTKVFNTIQENPTLCVAAAGVVLMLGGTIYKVLKPAPEWSNDGTTALNVDVALRAVKRVHEAFETALENGDIDDENRLKISSDIVTRDDADLLSDLRLYNDATGMLNISYMPDRRDYSTYWMGRRESEKIVPHPKTDKEVFGPIGYDSGSLVKTFQNVYDAFTSGYEAGDYAQYGGVNLGDYGLRPIDVDVLELMGLCKKGERLVRLFYWAEDKYAVLGTCI